MGKPTGFMEFTRKATGVEAPSERAKHYNEFNKELDLPDRQKQASRCMDCGVPFCQSGVSLGGMTSGCPINNLIPEWNDLIYRGLWKEAYKRLMLTNNFPEFTGRVCPAPCEGSCTVSLNDKAVTIKNNELSIIETAYENGWVVPNPPKTRSEKKVAVVGSGPAGLACADELNKSGHTVTVFEREDRIGGLLMYGIPNMKLDKRIVQKRIDLMAEEGVVFQPNVEVGIDYNINTLFCEYDAVVLCGGATIPRNLEVPGRNLKGINFAMDYLKHNTKNLLGSLPNPDPSLMAHGKQVIVIGGGDTGTDCVGTALRQECASVVQFELMPEPPKERTPGNPWPQWPKVLKTDYGQQEAIDRFEKDPREFSILTKCFVGDPAGNVKEVHTVKVEWKKNAEGRFAPEEIPGSEQVWPADLVLIAMGFLGPEKALLEKLNVSQDERTNVKTKRGSYATNIPGIFSAGDMRRGQSLVVWAIDEGRRAAAQCNKYLAME